MHKFILLFCYIVADLLRQIFVLSAVSPEKMSLVVQNVQKILKVSHNHIFDIC